MTDLEQELHLLFFGKNRSRNIKTEKIIVIIVIIVIKLFDNKKRSFRVQIPGSQAMDGGKQAGMQL